MKKITFLLTMMVVALTMSAQSLYVGTYNVRCLNGDDTNEGNGWTRRCPHLCNIVNFENPDIFGTQEAFLTQIKDMLKCLPEYAYIGVARDDGKESGEHSAIFYKKDKFKLLDHGDFWLNETPEKPALGWDAACVRICTWGKFKDNKTKLKFYFFNLHMDHVGIVARREAAKLVISKIKEIAGENAAVILTGDFNVDQRDEIYKIISESGIMKDSYNLATYRMAENGTYVDYKTDRFTQSRIDHIFVSNGFAVDRYGVVTGGYWVPSADVETVGSANAPRELRMKKFEHRLPSDHYPVFAKIHYKK